MDIRHFIKQLRFQSKGKENEIGQSIVLIALALVAIIAFLGIAVDVGFIFVKGSQLQAAIDSASLAGVTELSGWTPSGSGNAIFEGNARTKSAQFLNANGMPITVTGSLNNNSNIFVRQTELGAIEYSITGTWPIETFFLNVIGFNGPINLTRSATAAIFSKADIYASRRIEDGIISTSNQAVFGQNICTDYGDPFSPLNSPWQQGPYTYQYRIMIPADYPYNEVRVELFDPDSMNAQNQTFTIARTNAAILQGLSPTTTGTCTGSSMNQKNPCLIDTGELELYNDGILALDQINPYFFWRIDENRGAGAAPGNGGCGQPGSYNETYNTRTLYTLSYYRQNADSTTQKVTLASYTGQVGDGSRDTGDHQTDMHWVSPGAPASFDQPANVPADPGSATSFQIDLTSDVPNIIADQSTGARYLNLEITALDGASENGFEVWAGPPNYINAVPSEANARNLHVLNTPGSHSSRGVTVFASGNLPMNSNVNFAVDIPLIYVGPEMAGQDIFVSLFDTDSGAQPPITFFFDSIAQADWSYTFAQGGGVPDPDGQTRNCVPGGCNNRWVDPPYKITVPGNTENCDYSDPTNDIDCVPFYGGRLTANYIGGTHDTYGWQITVAGLPYLVK